MSQFQAILELIDKYIWGVPLIVLIIGTGLLLTIRLAGVQFRNLRRAFYYVFHSETEGEGDVSSFGALSTALAATVGTGNMVGVATAVVTGGAGALFWMELAACVGMATTYAEGLLSIKYRVQSENGGHKLGGPFYYIQNGMGERWKWLAKLFAFFGCVAGVMGIGTITQVNSIVSSMNMVFDPNNENIAFSIGGNDYSWATTIGAVVVAACTALVVIGGIQRIANFASFVVPAMILGYVLMGTALIIYNWRHIPDAIVEIVQSAFGLRAVAGGALGSMMLALQMGVARGIFSNEAGLGSAPIAASAATTKEPVRQGLISMTGPFLDTIVICTMTGLSIVITDAHKAGVEGVAVTIKAFGGGLPWGEHWGAIVVCICLTIFAYTTILGWDFYGERCLEYLTNGRMKIVKAYRWIYVLAVLIGPFLTLSFVWTIADIFNAAMAFPNLVALLALSGVVVKETRSYFDRMKTGELHDEWKEHKLAKKQK